MCVYVALLHSLFGCLLVLVVRRRGRGGRRLEGHQLCAEEHFLLAQLFLTLYRLALFFSLAPGAARVLGEVLVCLLRVNTDVGALAV